MVFGEIYIFGTERKPKMKTLRRHFEKNRRRPLMCVRSACTVSVSRIYSCHLVVRLTSITVSKKFYQHIIICLLPAHTTQRAPLSRCWLSRTATYPRPGRRHAHTKFTLSASSPPSSVSSFRPRGRKTRIITAICDIYGTVPST